MQIVDVEHGPSFSFFLVALGVVVALARDRQQVHGRGRRRRRTAGGGGAWWWTDNMYDWRALASLSLRSI